MSQKIKVGFWTILILIIMNCGIVFASKATEGLDYVLDKESDFTSFMNTEEYTDVINILENYDNTVIYKYESTVTYLYVYSTNGVFIKQANGQFKASEASNFIRIYRYADSGLWTYRSTNSSSGQAFVPTEIIFTSDTIFDWEGNEVLPPTDTYKTPYYEITLDYKGESSIQANGEKIKAYTYNSIYDTGITTIGNKFLKLGYLYIDDNNTISNLLTSIPVMTKYSMNLLNSWEYILYETIYTTGEKENGYLKYEIRIPIEYVSTPNYYNIFFRSRDTEIQEDINIDFVLLNNTENSGTIGPIITPSGDTISGDEIEDSTTLGDIQNTITEIFQEPNKENVEEEIKQTVEQIETEMKEKLEENEIIKALEMAQNGFIEILRGEAGDFKISWDAVNLKYSNKISGDKIIREKEIIPEGEINFSKIARENESIRYVKTTLNTILSALFAMNIAIYLFNVITTVIGGYEDITREKTYNVNKTLKKDKDIKTKRGG